MSERIGLRLGKGMRARLREDLVILELSGADIARALGIYLDDWLEIEEGHAGVDDTLNFAMRDAGIDMSYVIGGFRGKVLTPVFLSSRGINRGAQAVLSTGHAALDQSCGPKPWVSFRSPEQAQVWLEAASGEELREMEEYWVRTDPECPEVAYSLRQIGLALCASAELSRRVTQVAHGDARAA